jgi:hypothetical protein
MHRTRILAGVVLIPTGAVWIGQGIGLLKGSSFMVGDPVWVVFGVAAVAVGIGSLIAGLRGRA